MDSQQISAIKAGLAVIDTAIAQAEGALPTADPDRAASLTATLVELRAERTRLQFELINAESAGVTAAPAGATEAMAMPGGTRLSVASKAPKKGAKKGPQTAGRKAAKTGPRPGVSAAATANMKKLHARLKAAASDQTIANAALKFATQVRDLVKTLRLVGDDPTKPKRKTTRPPR